MKDAYSLILSAIDNGTYRPGDRLVESELAERFGVSRTPVREAIRRLAGIGVLATRQGAGGVRVNCASAATGISRAAPSRRGFNPIACAWVGSNA